jgi:hypothetical protein
LENRTVKRLALVLLLLAGVARADELELVLSNAVWRAEKPEDRKPLTLKLRRDGQQWQPLVMGHSRRYNFGDHYGFLAEAKEVEGKLSLRIKLRLQPDPWSDTGGYAEYAVNVNEGQWTGQCHDIAGNGAVTARWHRQIAEPAATEHPRLLVRKADIPALRAKAKTEWGQKALERLKATDASKSNMAVGRGLLYLLTGEKAFAEEARRLLQEDLDESAWQWRGYPYHQPGITAMEAAFAYDLIHDTCDEAFHRQMREAFDLQLDYCYRGADNPLFNPHDASNWSAMFRTGVGMSALSLIGLRGEYPPAPARPELVRLTESVEMKDVPVVKLETGKFWTAWAFAGPFKVSPRVEPPAKDMVFAPLDSKALISAQRAAAINQPAWEGVVDLTVAINRGGPATCYLAAVIENDVPGYYRIEMLVKKMIEPSITIAGRRFVNGDILYLGKGHFPVIARLPVTKTDQFTNVEFFLKLHATEEAVANAWLKKLADGYTINLALWEAGRSRGVNPVHGRWLGVGRQRIENWANQALGDIGWNHEGEGYTQHSYRSVLPFAHAYRNVTGHELVAAGKFNTAFLGYVGRTVAGHEAVRMQGFAPGGGPLGVDNWARGFGLVAESFKPVCLWTWNRTQAVADAGNLKSLDQPVAELDPMSAAFRFVNYPVTMTEQNPGTVRDRIVADRDRGGFVFRNRWQDDDDIVATFWLDSNHRGGGWGSSEAGEFRLLGLGADWAVRGMGWGNGGDYRNKNIAHPRLFQNALFVPKGSKNGHNGVVMRSELQADGSGAVSANLDSVYQEVSGQRSFAADYSGVCGAPALFAVADKVAGVGGNNVWQLVTEKDHKVMVAGNTFTITAKNGASLRGTVVLPATAKIEVLAKKIRHEINYHGGHKRADFPRQVISVAGTNAFLIIMTLQKDVAPAVAVQGDSVQVGQRKVCCVGADVVLE